jgi:hypothetical protein
MIDAALLAGSTQMLLAKNPSAQQNENEKSAK